MLAEVVAAFLGGVTGGVLYRHHDQDKRMPYTFKHGSTTIRASSKELIERLTEKFPPNDRTNDAAK